MSNLVVAAPRIAPMSPTAVDKVRQLEALAARQPQVNISTDHDFHAGMYARTILIPAGVMITGALIKIATMLIVAGDALIYIGTNEPMRVGPYEILHASAGRKQAIVALTDTYLTMIFPTKAQSVKDAERDFTDEVEILMSRLDPKSNRIRITEEE